MRCKYVQAFMTEDKTNRIIAWEFVPTVGLGDESELPSFDTDMVTTPGKVFLFTRDDPADVWPAPRKIGIVTYGAFVAMMRGEGFIVIEPVA